MEQGFDPKQYRKNLVEQVRLEKTKADQRIAEAEGLHPVSVWEVQQNKREQVRAPLKLARWSEEYYRAKLLIHGNFSRDGEVIIENESGLSTSELAERAKLFDYCEYSIQEVVKLLPELHLPEAVFVSERAQQLARHLLWVERNYGGGLLEQSEQVIAFVQKFGMQEYLKKALAENLGIYAEMGRGKDAAQFLAHFPIFSQEELKAIISPSLDIAAKRGYRKYGKELYESFPVFEKEEIKKRLDARFYPLPDRLKGSVEAKELFGTVLEGEGDDVTVDKVAPIFQAKAELLAQDIAQDPFLYWELKDCLVRNQRQMPYGGGYWQIQRDDALGIDKNRHYCRAVYYLNPPADERLGNPDFYWKAREGARLEFRFSCSEVDAKQEEETSYGLWDRYFTTTKIFRFEGLFIGNRHITEYESGKQDGILVAIDSDSDQDFSSLSHLRVRKEVLQTLAEDLLAPEKSFEDSLAALRILVEKYQLPETEIEDLIRAIQEFGTYMYRKTRADIGDCLNIPRNFASFCRKKFGIELEGARYGEYHPEWGSSMGYDPYTFYHEVSVYDGKLVIDWTGSQYVHHCDKPMPHIYEIGGERKTLGPLYRLHSRSQDPQTDHVNELFINDPKHPLYIKEEPVGYGI